MQIFHFGKKICKIQGAFPLWLPMLVTVSCPQLQRNFDSGLNPVLTLERW